MFRLTFEILKITDATGVCFLKSCTNVSRVRGHAPYWITNASTAGSRERNCFPNARSQLSQSELYSKPIPVHIATAAFIFFLQVQTGWAREIRSVGSWHIGSLLMVYRFFCFWQPWTLKQPCQVNYRERLN